MSGPNPLEISGRRVGPAFVGWLMSRPFPLGALGLIWRARGVGSGPKVPTMPPFSYRGGRPSPTGKKSKINRRIMGNILLLMPLNFQRKFYNFFATALDAIGSPGSILRYRSSYKRRG